MGGIPNFFIVGAPKAGTTSLYHHLRQHPDIYMSEVKEPDFFSADEIRRQGLYYPSRPVVSAGEYRRLFAASGDASAIGEASVSYLFYASVPGKIRRFNPRSRIIIMLRNPVERAFSHYLMDRRLGLVSITFADAVRRRTDHPRRDLYHQQYVALGQYREQVQRYLDRFGEGAVKLILFEDFMRDRDGILREIFRFLGVSDAISLPDSVARNAFKEPRNRLIGRIYARTWIRRLLRGLLPRRWLASLNTHFFRRDKPEFDDATRAYLLDFYRPDIRWLSEHLGRDLESSWK